MPSARCAPPFLFLYLELTARLREQVFEETGFDTERWFPREQLKHGFVEPEGCERAPYYIELVIKEQKIRLYFIPEVPEDTYFLTQTRKEISVRPLCLLVRAKEGRGS